MGQRHDGMSIVESNGRKWPVLNRTPTQRFQIGSQCPYDAPLGRVFLDRKSQEMRDQVISASQLPCHTRLHVGVVGLWLQGYLCRDGTLSVDLQESGLGPQFRHECVAVVKALGGPDLFIFWTESVPKHNLLVGRYFLNPIRESQ